jgi:hypothetical protein
MVAVELVLEIALARGLLAPTILFEFTVTLSASMLMPNSVPTSEMVLPVMVAPSPSATMPQLSPTTVSTLSLTVEAS